MEDKKRKKDDKRKREASQKVAEQKNKVPELTKPLSTQSPAAPSSASPSPGPIPSASSSPATAAAGGAPPQGGNNAKRPAVANGQPPTAGTQAPQRYMPREVPPRFRCQQDHKVLLKRGQPPLSSMLLGGGGGGGDGLNATMAAASDSSPGYVGPAAPSLPLTSSSSSSSIAASSTSSNYANSTWGTGSGSLPSSQGREKVIVDGSDLEEWPNIAPGDGSGGGGASGPGSGSESSVEGGGGMPNSCASWKGGDPGSPSPTSSFSMSNECMLSGSVVWGSAASQGPVEGNAAPGTSLPPIPKSSPLPVGPDGSLGGSGGIPGANFNPNANPSAWPALVQQDGAGAASSEGAPPSSFLQSQVGSLSANNPPPALGNPPLALNQSAHQHQLHQMQSREREHPSDGGWGGAALETGAGPKNAGTGEGANIDCGGGGNGGDNLSASQTSSSWGGQPFPAANSKTGASRTDGWEGGAAEGGGGSRWGYSAQGVMEGKPGALEVGVTLRPPGYLREGGEEEESEGLQLETGEVIQVGWVEVVELAIQEGRLVVSAAAAVAAAAVGAASATPLPPPLLPNHPPLQQELWTIRRELEWGTEGQRGTQGSGGGAGVEEVILHPEVAAITINTMGMATTGIPIPHHPTLKWPYRQCSAAMTWTRASSPTQAGARPRSDRTWPGT
uniref:Uncharacterized protein n=1 Tax=Oncorhynchus tshawytscha TaxID=74940 RepID=A0AAZ3QFW5_ONCTS